MTTTVPLKAVATLRVSNVDKKAADGEKPVRLCNYTNVYYNTSITIDMPFMSATASSAQVAAFGLRTGDILITKDSETAEAIGVAAYVASSEADIVCGYHLALIRPDSSQVHGRFLYWSMASQFVREQLTIAATGVTRFGLRSNLIAEARVPRPPLQEQRAIVDFIDTETAHIDALIARRLIHKSVQLIDGEHSRETPETCPTI